MLADYYKSQGIFDVVDGVGSADEVLARIVTVIDAARERRPVGA